MLWRRKRRTDLEIAPEEIFLDSSSDDFDRARFEGRLEKPLSPRTYFFLSAAVTLLVVVLLGRAWSLQVRNGEAYAAESARNSLETTTLFAPRGVITDVQGAVLAENIVNQDGGVSRHYPVPSLSHILGYVSYPKKDSNGFYYETEEKGITGLEAEYDDLLSGENGHLLVEKDALGRVRSQGSVIPARQGESLALSIDAGLQKPFAQAVAAIVEDKRFIAGSGVIMDVETGAVRAIVSYPSFDSNVMSSGGPSSVIASYNADIGHPFIDHAVQGVYVPGSIVKPFVALGALTDGIITARTVIDDPGFISVPDPYHPGKEFIYRSWRPLGLMDVKKAIAWSSDVFFYSVGGGFKSQQGLGIGRLQYWYQQFGLGKPTGIDVAGEAKGLIPDPAWKQQTFREPWYLGDTYFTAIGQYSMQVTPIQMARATAALANGGKLFTPTLLAHAEPSFTTIAADQSMYPIVRAGMRLAVTNALAGEINLPYVSVAAKTGTAQTGSRNQFDNSWVIGFFPYEKPRYSFAVVLERGPAGTGSQAVNVMRDLFTMLYSADSPYVGGAGKNETATSTSY